MQNNFLNCPVRSARSRNDVNFGNLKDMESIFNCIHNYITDYSKNAFYHIYKYF